MWFYAMFLSHFSALVLSFRSSIHSFFVSVQQWCTECTAHAYERTKNFSSFAKSHRKLLFNARIYNEQECGNCTSASSSSKERNALGVYEHWAIYYTEIHIITANILFRFTCTPHFRISLIIMQIIWNVTKFRLSDSKCWFLRLFSHSCERKGESERNNTFCHLVYQQFVAIAISQLVVVVSHFMEMYHDFNL